MGGSGGSGCGVSVHHARMQGNTADSGVGLRLAHVRKIPPLGPSLRMPSNLCTMQGES